MRRTILAFVFPFAIWPIAAFAADARIVRDGVTFSIGMRDTEGVTAFYAARGLSKLMLDAIGQTCFVGVGIHNNRNDTLWLDLDNWRFIDKTGREVKRITRPEWDTRWDRIKAPYAGRAAFDWTQLPENRDLQPSEPVGGNVAVIAPNSEFGLVARFRTGDGNVLEFTVPGLSCKEARP